MSPEDRAFRRGDQVRKKRDLSQRGRVENERGPLRGTVVVFWKEGILQGRETPVFEDELVLSKAGPTLREHIEWLCQARRLFRQAGGTRAFTEQELARADVYCFEGYSPEDFVLTLTKEI